MSKNCINCGVSFLKPYTTSVVYFLEKRKYCSYYCRSKANSEVGLKNLRSHGSVSIEKMRTTIKAQFRNGRKNIQTYIFPKGKNNPAYIDGRTSKIEKIRKSDAYTKWRIEVFQRDNYTCQSCGKYGGKLNADHVMAFSLYPDFRLEVLNGRTLCVACHKKTENYGSKSRWSIPKIELYLASTLNN